MGKVLLEMSMSLDGYVAGPGVSAEAPMGRGGELLHEWVFEGRSAAESQHFETDHFSSVGALIIGRRMADLGIGPWGDEPTFHAPKSSWSPTGPPRRSSREAARRTSSSPKGPTTPWSAPGMPRGLMTCRSTAEQTSPGAAPPAPRAGDHGRRHPPLRRRLIAERSATPHRGRYESAGDAPHPRSRARGNYGQLSIRAPVSRWSILWWSAL